MRAKSIWRAGLLAVLVAAVLVFPTGTVTAQSLGYALPDWDLPVPWGSTRPEAGGLFVAAEYVMYRQTNPLENEVVATRGFYNFNQPIGNSLQFFGSDTVALDTNQVRGPLSYQPGVNLHIGWKTPDGDAFTLSWLYLFQVRYQAVATSVPPNFNVGATFADSFLTAPVYNFPNDYAGSVLQQNGPGGVATYGIWDGASIMTESFVQRDQQYDFIWRHPVYETEDYRLSSLIGPRFFWIWEGYEWRTTNFGFTGSEGPSANYSNIDSNRMYGLSVGCSQEWYCGGGIAIQLDTDATGYLNIVKERVQYSTEQKFAGAAENKRATTDYTAVPELEAKLNVVWYPLENVQLKLGYNFMGFFNTIQSQMPIDFNYSSIDPKFDHIFFRDFDGWQAGISIVF